MWKMEKFPAFVVLSFLLFASVFAYDVVEITESNFEEKVANSGKNTFIKFYAPWCGHCKKLKPDWDKLGTEFLDSTVTIGEVDCTVEKELCTTHGVTGYPTLKYFTTDDTSESKPYQSGRDFDSLKKFVDESLAKKCEVADPINCDEREKDFMEKMKAKGSEETAKQLKRLEGMKNSAMKPELKSWLSKRISILKQL